MAGTGLRRTAVVIGVAAAIIVPAVTNGFHLGLSQAQFAADGDGTLRAAPYAFAIWGLIYAALVAYAVFQARGADSATRALFGWPSVVATLSCAAWIVASTLDWKAASVVIILIGAGAALTPLLRRPEPDGLAERLLVVWPNALLAGWLTIAAALNILTVLTAWDVITPAGAQAWAIGAVAVVVALALFVEVRARSATYLLPIAWGLLAVHAAEETAKPLVANLAHGSAAFLVLAAIILVFVKPARR